jgi:D-serine deaminase-like pyridoxal phosphate-dependent protein
MTQRPPAAIGMSIDEVETPALIVDLDAFERNLRRMADAARAAGVRVRPHSKTHKSTVVALKQVALGAVGNCCQTVGEAEALVAGGIKDVLVSNEVVGERKFMRLAALARDATIALCVDAAEQVDAAARAAASFDVQLGVLVEIETGMKRCGVAPGEPARALAHKIKGSNNLRFRGLQAYHGTAQHLLTYEERRVAVNEAIAAVKSSIAAIKQEGLDCEIVGGAGTGTFRFEAASGVYNELQVGSYAFMDTDYARIQNQRGGRFDDFEHSLFILSSALSLPEPGRVVMDAGLKSFSAEKGLPWIHGREGFDAYGVSDEHLRVRLPSGASMRYGERLWLIPGHCDPTINLHDWYVGVRKGRVEALWPINARGASA